MQGLRSCHTGKYKGTRHFAAKNTHAPHSLAKPLARLVAIPANHHMKYDDLGITSLAERECSFHVAPATTRNFLLHGRVNCPILPCSLQLGKYINL